jgi:hypothetical protein
MSDRSHRATSPGIGSEAEITNPALKGFAFLLGTWRTEGTHPQVPDKTFHGRTRFELGYGGAFLVMHSEIDEPEIPSGVAIIASDDAGGPWSMLYFDERGVSRRYTVSVGHREMTTELNDPKFSQTMTLRADPTAGTLQSRGRMKEGDGPWQDDLELTYRRDDAG